LIATAAAGPYSSRRLCEAPHNPIAGFAFRESLAYLRPMPKFEFCIPTVGKTVPSAPEWFHEIKYDGYRLRVERDGDSVRLITRGGYDWTKRFPWIAEAALKNRRSQFRDRRRSRGPRRHTCSASALLTSGCWGLRGPSSRQPPGHRISSPAAYLFETTSNKPKPAQFVSYDPSGTHRIFRHHVRHHAGAAQRAKCSAREGTPSRGSGHKKSPSHSRDEVRFSSRARQDTRGGRALIS